MLARLRGPHREFLVHGIWQADIGGVDVLVLSNTIEVFVTRIRKKLGADVITTIRGLGYSLEDPHS